MLCSEIAYIKIKGDKEKDIVIILNHMLSDMTP